MEFAALARPQHVFYVPTPSELRCLQDYSYKLTIKVGEGGFSKVYLTEFTPVRDGKKLKFTLACKLIDTKNAPTKFVTKFLPQELKLISKLNHPHIIEIHSIFQRKEKFYIFMRHAESGDLLDYIINKGPVDEPLAKIWTRQIALALQYLHMLELAHRDIKCENIVVTVHNNVKVTDFGFARSTVDSLHQSVLSETYCGSISYASPQIVDGVPYNPKATDMWSLGCVIFIMLNKTAPFPSSNMKRMYYCQMSRIFKFRAKYSTKYDKSVIQLVDNLLEPIENLRYKIEQVLGSQWISMEPALRVLNRLEYKALADAMEIANRFGTDASEPGKDNTIRTSVAPKKFGSISFFKEYEEGFDLQLIDSEVNASKRISS